MYSFNINYVSIHLTLNILFGGMILLIKILHNVQKKLHHILPVACILLTYKFAPRA